MLTLQLSYNQQTNLLNRTASEYIKNVFLLSQKQSKNVASFIAIKSA